MRFLLTIAMTLFALASFNAYALIGQFGGSAALTAAGAVKAGTLEQHYIKVRNSHSAALTDGMVVVDDLSDDDGVSVTATTTASLKPRCVISQTSCAVGAMCKCQVYGLHSTAAYDRTATDGSAGDATAGYQGYVGETTAGYIEAKPLTRIDGQDHPVGTFLDAESASGAVQMFINLL